MRGDSAIPFPPGRQLNNSTQEAVQKGSTEAESAIPTSIITGQNSFQKQTEHLELGQCSADLLREKNFLYTGTGMFTLVVLQKSLLPTLK